MFDVFLSHSHRDEARARQLAEKLAEWDISVYVDLQDEVLATLPDSDLAERLVEKLRQCRLLLFAFSEEAAASRWMPWELGLAHGVIGRVVLWPFTKRALQAKEVQEYLGLYEALDSGSARIRLTQLLGKARRESIRPADRRAMQDLAGATIVKMPEFNNPAVAAEFMAVGPFQLYSAWIQALIQAWKP
jgi:TIR domain